MFTFYMPTRVVVGKTCVVKESNLLKGIGNKALIVTGKYSSKQNGALEDVQKALEQQEIAYCLFDEVEENPSLETVERARDFGLMQEVDCVIGIGGGSPIDAAKAIAVMLKNPELTGDTLIGTGLKSLPVVAVPTTAGTGTEVTQYAIVTDHQAKTKKNIGHTVFPVLAFVDATYMKDMPLSLTVHTAIDAMSHLVESYLSVKSNVVSEALVIQGLQEWGKCIPHLLDGQLTLEDRESLMMASMLGGMAIAQTGTSLPHGMGYALTYYKGLPHGLANGVLYKAYLRGFKDRTKVQKLHTFVGLESHEALEKVLDTLCQAQVEVTPEELEAYTKAMCSNKAKLQNHPESISEQEVYRIYADSLLH